MSTQSLVTQNETPDTTTRYTYTPKVDIWETEDDIYVQAEMPGVSQKTVDVKLEDHILSILGRVEMPDVNGFEKVYSEYEAGTFERSFRLTNEIDPDKIEARVAHGVLSLRLPKSEAAKPRRIKIMAG